MRLVNIKKEKVFPWFSATRKRVLLRKSVY